MVPKEAKGIGLEIQKGHGRQEAKGPSWLVSFCFAFGSYLEVLGVIPGGVLWCVYTILVLKFRPPAYRAHVHPVSHHFWPEIKFKISET